MSDTSLNRAKIAAALIWYAGGIALTLKGWGLLTEADRLQPQHIWPWLAVVAGLTAGGIQAQLVFVHSCRKNLERIDALEHPKIWHCFRPRFFLFLLAMITAGGILSRTAHNNYFFLIGVATLDVSIASALLGSSRVFWGNNTFRE
jgi:hypothetical protein